MAFHPSDLLRSARVLDIDLTATQLELGRDHKGLLHARHQCGAVSNERLSFEQYATSEHCARCLRRTTLASRSSALELEELDKLLRLLHDAHRALAERPPSTAGLLAHAVRLRDHRLRLLLWLDGGLPLLLRRPAQRLLRDVTRAEPALSEHQVLAGVHELKPAPRSTPPGGQRLLVQWQAPTGSRGLAAWLVEHHLLARAHGRELLLIPSAIAHLFPHCIETLPPPDLFDEEARELIGTLFRDDPDRTLPQLLALASALAR